jgi:uncharacterized protein YjbI with pentapeptide repeats
MSKSPQSHHHQDINDPRPYHKKDLSNENFSKLNRDFSGVDFSFSTFYNTDFTNVRLCNANFAHANINGANFEGAKLQGADFTQAVVKPVGDDPFKEVNFHDSKIQGAIFYKSHLENADFSKSISGLIQTHYIKILTFFAILSSGFTASIAMTFYLFFTSDRKKSMPGQRPSILNSICVFIASTFILTFVRICISDICIYNKWGSNGIITHMAFGVAFIFLVLALALFKRDSKIDPGSLIWIAIIAILPLVISQISSIRIIEQSLKNSFLSSFIFKLGIETNGSILSGLIGSMTGSLLGCCFSQLAICKNDRIIWLNFDWLWRWYVNFASTSGTIFNYATLTNANFTSATLKGASFENAVISKINWHDTKYLDCANIGLKNYLEYPAIRYLLVMRNWGEQDNFDGLNLEGIYLEGMDLKGSDSKKASFVGTNLNKANLRHAVLNNAILRKASLDGADLTEATLTGACIQSWSIDEKTKLEGVKCEYVFLKDDPDPKTGIRERIPNAAAGEFKTGEFETIFKKDNSIVQLFIRSTDNRKVLDTAFKQLIQQNTDSVFQGFEILGESALVKIRVPNPSSKDAVSTKFYDTVNQIQVDQKSNNLEEDQDQPFEKFVLHLAIDLSNMSKYNFNQPNIASLNIESNIQDQQIT